MMEFNYKPYFDKYEVLVKAADQIFAQMEKDFPGCVNCKIECSDCCNALFDLTLIEAIYINKKFNESIVDHRKENIIDHANSTDRKIAKIKRKAYKELQAGKNEGEILADLSVERARCPFLNSGERCALYEYRPLTCRLYGIPTSIGGSGHSCGKANFKMGKEYPTVNLDNILKRLQEISAELIKDMKSKHIKLIDLLVPLSMAILTEYNEEYFGFENSEKEE